MSGYLTLDIQGVSKILRRLAAVDAVIGEPNRFIKQSVAKTAVRLIRSRTAKGLDKNETPFTGYVESHLRARRAKGLSTSLVNLKFGKGGGAVSSRGMLGDMRGGIRGGEAAIYFNSAHSRLKARLLHHGGGKSGGLPPREFLGFERGTRSHESLQNVAKDALRRQLQRILRQRL